MHDQFEKWTQQWEDALKSGVFQPRQEQVPSAQRGEDDFFGNHRPASAGGIDDVDAAYWNDVYKLSKGEVLNEKFYNLPPTKFDGATAPEITDDMGKLPNPVKPYTRGQDSANKVTPNFSSGKELEELAELKVRLEKLESAFNRAEGLADEGKAKAVRQQLAKVKAEVERLSDSLSPEFRTDYLS